MFDSFRLGSENAEMIVLGFIGKGINLTKITLNRIIVLLQSIVKMLINRDNMLFNGAL